MVDDIFGFIPNNIELYKVALIHKSASIVVEGQTINNERLEFLGDAVIESVTSDYLLLSILSTTRAALLSCAQRLSHASRSTA